MTKQEAKRWVCSRLHLSLAAGLVEDEATESLSEADQERVSNATGELIEELRRRAGTAAATEDE